MTLRSGFHVALSNRRAQAATMVLVPGGAEGGTRNRHSGVDQWRRLLKTLNVYVPPAYTRDGKERRAGRP